MHPSRREFLRWGTVSGIMLSMSRFAGAQNPGTTAGAPVGGQSSPFPPKGRIDGFAKVTGAKLYPSDFRAADMPGWPAETAHALLVRAPDATHTYEGIDLSALEAGSRPTVVVTAEDLAKAGVQVPPFYAGDLFCPPGQTPLYLGQPVALLLFEGFDAFDRARTAFRNRELVRFGGETGPIKQPNYAALRFTRVAGPTPEAPDIYSPVQEGWVGPGFTESSGRPIWKPLPVAQGGDYAKGAAFGEEIRQSLATPAPNLFVLDRSFETQSIDPMFLEPESGLAWYEPGSRTLDILLGVQSPFEAASSVAFLLGEAQPGFRPARINARFASIGGGFGGRDHTPFPLYVALAAMFMPGRAVRLAHDRFQQFQGGIKRHAFQMRSQIAIDRATGKMLAFAADHVLDGGGLANYSASVAVVGATAAIGIYDIPKVDVTTVAEYTRGVTAGSMRGYGTLQTLTALETLIDEAASALKIDPIELRRRNLLKTGGRTMTGNPWTVSVRTPEILDKLAAHPIWRDRAARKASAKGVLVGTGIACCTKDYGTGADCSLGRVEVAPDGAITIHADAVEMGNGIGTAISRRVAAILGRTADAVNVARINMFDELGLVTTGDPYTMSQAEQDAAAKNPRWVPEISSATSASIGAHVGTQAAAKAARVVFRFGLWPAALDLWGIKAGDPREFLFEQAFWQDNELILSGLPPLAQADVAARAHQRGDVTGAMAHAFSRWAWAQAAFPLGGMNWAADIDALAVRRGSGAFAALDRSFVFFPPTDYNRIGTAFTSSCGTAVRIEITPASGAVRIAEAYSVFECGEVLVPELVEGQAQGGFAMGVGYTLLESLPPFEDGPGNGRWNLGDYVVARASDLPLHSLEIEVLPAVSTREQPKGMAEVIMIPVVPALLNAIHDATGHRFQSLPVTPDMLKRVLT
ncbi:MULTISPECIES: molybdopterin cofactor-binding domain-containing protein [unclassified Chelatococcus]|uniref:xanthine dehydrogenase family protein molybdopterin-binding subunit n=1 Tax=unclassified Chelatococcus TaxID=2638111 RepID=UPI001BCC56AE|nr:MULTISPECIES: molybdopterin cofactor-binding domain-containing protein [unclassified Chelatococcus]MBS7699439.1 xanthine dehydrogenase family protein molybdopterin-binding subunit [Chelatococcus sp. YT9]MBX3557669.1 xanthine dehydrogenase family protein molybdopterin-binding subunit [Chelatococcus sp.]